MDETVKLTFIGDIMCEKPLQRAFERYGKSVFDDVFAETKALLSKSDRVIGCLETVFGGNRLPYTNELYRFNTPDEFASATVKGGIDTVVAASNHSLDAGVDGLCRTADILDKNGIARIGIYKTPDEPRVLITEIKGIRIALLNHTYGTNTHENGNILTEDEIFHLGLLKPQTFNLQTYDCKKAGRFRKRVSLALAKVLDAEQRIRLKKLLGMEFNPVRIDHLDPAEFDVAYTERIIDELRFARKNADVVIACPHCGGQFNPEPGEFSRYVMRLFADNGADAVIGCHAHVVQSYEYINGVFAAFCLGSYSISPSSVYLLPALKPDHSVAVHVYIGMCGIKRITFSVLKAVENKYGAPVVYPVNVLYDRAGAEERIHIKEDIDFICMRFAGRMFDEVLPEYPTAGSPAFTEGMLSR